jgi:hypothetical protein
MTTQKMERDKMTQTIENFILAFVSGNGSGHIKEIHLEVMEIRPEVPQDTILPRLLKCPGEHVSEAACKNKKILFDSMS